MEPRIMAWNTCLRWRPAETARGRRCRLEKGDAGKKSRDARRHRSHNHGLQQIFPEGGAAYELIPTSDVYAAWIFRHKSRVPRSHPELLAQGNAMRIYVFKS